MAAIQIQKKEYNSTVDDTDHSIILDSSPTEGNLIVVCIVHDGAIDTAPVGYTSATSAVDFIWGRMYYKIAGASESATISIVLADANPCCIQAFEYSGMKASPLDKVVSAIDAGSGTTIVSGTTETTSQDNELLFVSANMRMDVGGQTVTAWSNSFTSENESISTGAADVDVLLNVATRIVSATGTYQSTGTITTGGLGNDVALLASFKIEDSLPIVSWFIA